MDTQSYFEHGGSLVRNPNYSPDNGQPKFIRRTDVSKSDNPLASAFYKSAEEGENYTITDKDLVSKSKKYNIPLTRRNIESGAIDKELYDAQSGLSMFLNAVEQTVVSEIGLGTLKGLSDLIDGIICMMNSDTNFYGPVNLGNPGEFTMLELAEKVIKLTNSKSKIIYRELPGHDSAKRKPDISFAKEKLNWEPVIDLDEGLKISIEYFKNELVDRKI